MMPRRQSVGWRKKPTTTTAYAALSKEVIILIPFTTINTPPSADGITQAIADAVTSVIGALFALAAPLFQAVGFIVVCIWVIVTLASRKKRG